MEVGVMAILVREYKNGVLVGSVVRDMQIYTQPCSNILPRASGVNGSNNYSIVACPGKPFSFTINSIDPDNSQIVSMDWNFGIAGANFSTNNDQRPTGTFSWTPSLSDARIQPYTFTLTVIDNNCPSYGSQTYSYNVFVPPLSVSTGTSIALCSGTASGTATASASGTGPFQYVWTPGNYNGASVNGLMSGTYSVLVTDQYGCTTSATDSVGSAPPLSGTIISTTDASCNGISDGRAVVAVSGGMPPYTYNWSPAGGNSASATGLAAGNYTVVIRDAHNCPVSLQLSIGQPNQLVLNTSTNPSTCGQSNGSASVVVSGGSPPYSYTWNPGGSSNASLLNISAGTYQLSVRDSHSCLSTSIVNVTNTSGPMSQISSITNVSCFGATNGSASVSVNGGTVPFTYIWSASSVNSPTINNLSAGTYSVKIRDANQCEDSLSFTVTQPANIQLSSSSNSTNCFAGTDGQASVNVSGGTTPYSFLWSTGLTTSSINGLSAGIYSVTVTDNNNCTKTHSVTISSPSALTTTVATSSMVTCYGAADGSAGINVTGGKLPYSYSWMPYGGNAAVANGLDTGRYTVTVRDANNCIATLSLNINQPPPLGISYSTVPAGCNLSNGSATVTVSGGTRPINYTWNPGSGNTATLSNISSGSYQVTVRDAHNCLLSSSVAVSNTSGPTAMMSSINNVLCKGANNGSASVTVSLGTAPYRYLWSSSTSQGSTASNLSAGSHSVTVTDSNNCVTAIPFVINEPTLLTSHGTATPATCYGKNDGTASALVSGGSAPYSYHWSNGQSNQSITQLLSGTYSLTCTDANGCISVTDAVVNQPSAIILHSISTPVSCKDGSDGQAIVQCSGGTPAYSYSWTNGSVSNVSSGLGAGNYSVTITDANGCTESNMVSISEPDALVLNQTLTDVTCFGSANGSATINVAGGTAPYRYNWFPSGATTATVSSLAAGNYSISVTDVHGCNQQQIVRIGQASQVQVNSQTTDVSCYGGNNGTASLSCTGGTSPYQYLWNDGNLSSNATQLSAGLHSVRISDQHGCAINKSIVINEPGPVIISISDEQTICIGQSVLLSVQGAGGIGPYSYYWYTGVNGQTQSVQPVRTSTYQAYVIDANGCVSDPDSVTVNVYPQLLAVTNRTDSICEGGSAQLTVTASGGNGGPYNYLWSNGESQQQLSVLPQTSTTYSVSVSDHCGTPPASAQFTVIVNPNPDPAFVPQPVDGCVPLKVPFSSSSGNQTLIAHHWSFGDGSISTEAKPEHTYLQPGQYSVRHYVMNSHRCSSESIAQKIVTVHPLPQATFYTSPESATLQTPRITFTNASVNAISYRWDFGDDIGTSTLRNPEYSYKDTGTYIVRLISESPNGCLDTTYGTVRVKPEFAIYIPNAFSPNGDGVNEGFMPLAIGARDIKMLIYDRWGLEIFHSTDSQLAWRGEKDGSDKACQMDVYIYIITAFDSDGRQYRYTGRVSLIR
jgi:gliding motility-associated-like protein